MDLELMEEVFAGDKGVDIVCIERLWKPWDG